MSGTLAATTREIPRIIHQIWIQGYDEMPEHYKRFAKEWRLEHPTWKYMFWDEVSLTKLIAEHTPQHLMRFLRYDRPVLKADFGRVVALWAHGGLYLDTDTQCVAGSPFAVNSHFPKRDTVYLSTALWPLQLPFIRQRAPQFPSNYAMAGPPRHRFWRHYIEHMGKDSTSGGSVQITGPLALGKMVPQFKRLGVEMMKADTFVLPSQAPQSEITAGFHNYESTWVPRVFRPLTQQMRYLPYDLLGIAAAGVCCVLPLIKRVR